MKNSIIFIIICVCSIFATHAGVVREGKNFRMEQAQQQDLPTVYTYTDKEGVIYTIYRSKSGSYYILKVSKKTGKQYKQYLPKEMQEELKALRA